MRIKLLCTQMILLLLLLAACSGKGSSPDAQALAFRTDYQAMGHWEGAMQVRADYGERVYDYTLSFTGDKEGETRLTIEKPDTLSGVTAVIAQGQTQLEFEGDRLETGPLSEEGVTPVDALPALLRYVTEGYIAECSNETVDTRACLRLDFRDPEAVSGDGEEAVIWLDEKTGDLVQAELIQDGFTVLYCQFTAFSRG